MPQDVTCPTCSDAFPITEARHAFTVACPRCETELTAEFKKRTGPVPAGEPPYEVSISEGALPEGANLSAHARHRRDDDENSKQGGSSVLVVILSGGIGLLFVLGGLSLVGWFLFTQIDLDDTETTTRPSTAKSGTTNPKVPGTLPDGSDPGRFTPGFNPGPTPTPTPTQVFDLRPVTGTLPTISPPKLEEDSSINLQSKVGAIAVAGGGRYLVMHQPDKGQLMLFDANTAGTSVVDSDREPVMLAGGLSRFAVLAGGNILRVYSLPGMTKVFEERFPEGGIRAIAMGSRTNGPLLAVGPFGDPVLVDVSGNSLTEIRGARQRDLGLHSHMIRAAPDGTAFVTVDPFDNNVKLLTESGRTWKITSLLQAPFPGVDGNFYGNGAVYNRSGYAQNFGGVGVGSGSWYVPAISNGNHFLKVTPFTVGSGAKTKRTLSVTIHGNRNANTPLPNTQALSGVADFDEIVDWSGNIRVPLDQHLFLIPEAKLLVILSGDKQRLYLRKVNI